jgi:UrcA family protein
MNPFRAVLITAATASGIAFAAPVFAGDPTEPQSVVVKYGDIDLTSERGAKALYTRLRAASRRVCSSLEGRDLRMHELWKACYDRALTKAVVDLNVDSLTALHQRGRSDRPS